jgi:CRP-like cAMP-binding protein
MSKDLAQLTAELDRVASRVFLRKGTPLFHCGDPLSGVFVVRIGAITMSIDGGTAYPPRTLGPGEIAGLPAAFTGHYSLSARVTEDAELGFIPGPKVTELLECSPRLCMLAIRAISEEITRARSALREIPLLDWTETPDSESSSSQQTGSD